jgi:hypothetical protein
VTFSFGTTSGTFSSMSMAIEEVVDQTAQLTTCAGTPPNPDVLLSTFPVVGSNWTSTVKTGLTRTKTGSWTLFVGDTPLGKPAGLLLSQFPKCPEPGGPTAGNFGTSKAGRKLLCNIDCLDPTTCFQVPIGAAKGSSSSCVIAIPKRISLVCFPFCAQADVFGNIASGALGGNHRLPTSLNGIIGTNAPKSSLQHLLRREPARIRCHPFGSRVSGVLSVTSSLSFTPQGFAHGSSSVPVARWSRLGSVRSSDQRTV